MRDGNQSRATQHEGKLYDVVDCTIPALNIVPALQAGKPAFSPGSSARYSLFPPTEPLPRNSPPPSCDLSPTERFCPPRPPQQLRHVSICKHGKAEPVRTTFAGERRRGTWWRPSCWRCACHTCLTKLHTCLWPCASAQKARPPAMDFARSTQMPAPREWGNSVEMSRRSIALAADQVRAVRPGAECKISSGEKATSKCLHTCQEGRPNEFRHGLVDRLFTGCYCQIVDDGRFAGDMLESPRPLLRRSFD